MFGGGAAGEMYVFLKFVPQHEKFTDWLLHLLIGRSIRCFRKCLGTIDLTIVTVHLKVFVSFKM